MFNQKESGLLQDLKKAEELCIEKYTKYAGEASTPQLQSLLNQINQQEQQHLQTINQILSGSVPSTNSGQQQSGQQQSQNNQQTQKVDNYAPDSPAYKYDSFICSDLLSTEKHISSSYNTSIFEFKNTAVRDALNHIQKEEQEHGQKLYNYMASNGMYN